MKQLFMDTRDNKAVDELLYLYCITGTMPAFQHVQESAADIHVVHSSGIYAVVGRVPSSEFDGENFKKNLSDMKWVESRVLRHEKVIEETMEMCSVVPFKFATLFKTEESVNTMLEEHIVEFKKSIELFEGREEWGVKVYCNLERLKASLTEDNEEIKKIEEEMSISSAGKSYFLKKRKDRLTEDMLNKKIHEYAQDSFKTMREQSQDACINEPLPKQATRQKDEMILNVAFLIDKTILEVFIDSVQYLKERYSPRGLDFDCTGPWPPYNFCSLGKD